MIVTPPPTKTIVDVCFIMGEYKEDDLHRAYLPDTAFDDPAMPQGVKRMLTLGEYIVERTRRDGWTLRSMKSGPNHPFHLMGKDMIVPHVTLTWRR